MTQTISYNKSKTRPPFAYLVASHVLLLGDMQVFGLRYRAQLGFKVLVECTTNMPIPGKKAFQKDEGRR